MTLRVALYARYSTDLQRDASIEDQLRLCRLHAERERWTIIDSYSDRAASGASLLRPAIQELIQDAQRNRFDIVLAEALDRLSRDQEDIAGLFKRLRFAGVRIVTLSEGEIGEMHIGLKGTMNALFLKDLALKTHRGLRGRIEAGRSAGGRCYGYDVVRRIDAQGEPIRGERAINPAEAAIVRRVFTMTAEGASPIAIAKALNAEHLPGPEGRAWGDTTIRGHALRGTGILRNELYIGRLVWNRMRFIKDPASGKRVSRMNPKSDWIIEEVPELRIVDDELWERVRARQTSVREASGADSLERPQFHERRRAQHILTGKVFCGCCGGAMAAVGQDYLACGAARRQGICANRQAIRRSLLDGLILDALKNQSMRPEHVELFVAEFTAEWNRLQGNVAAESAARKRELETVTRKLDGLIDAIAEGFRAPGLQQKLDDLEARKTELVNSVQASTVPAPRLHPNLARVYREKVELLHEALALPDDGRAGLEAVRGLIERIEISSHPADAADAKAAPEIVLTGEIGAMVDLALGEGERKQAAPGGAAAKNQHRDLFLSSVKVVAGTGFEPVTFRL